MLSKKVLTTLLTTSSIVIGRGLAAPVPAQTAKQTVTLTKVDPIILATGWRATAILGATVYNDAGEEIGKLEDMIITSKDMVSYAIVSVGGFLGMNEHRAVVTMSSLELVGDKLFQHGATTQSLKALPNYVFAS